MKTGVQLIAEERQRQISEESFNADHDNNWTNGQLAKAAACYALPEEWRRQVVRYLDNKTVKPVLRRLIEALWPWNAEWYRPVPGDRKKELVKAGALIAAELDRLNRLETK